MEHSGEFKGLQHVVLLLLFSSDRSYLLSPFTLISPFYDPCPQSTRVARLRTLSILAKCYPPRDAVLHSEAKAVLRVLGGLPPLSGSTISTSSKGDVEMLSKEERKKKKKSGNGIGIDDPKRRVRLEAVEARDAWFYRESSSAGDS